MTVRRNRGLTATSLVLLIALMLALVWTLQTRARAGHPPAIAPDSPYGFALGTTVYASDADLDRDFQTIEASGTRWVRIDFDWSLVEPVRGRLDWTRLDRLSALATSHRLRVLGVLAFTPPWARAPGTTSHGAPLNVAEFSEFAAAAVNRYAPAGIADWEVWNEPNLAAFWEPVPDPARYGALLRASAVAIHHANPEAVVLSAGLAPVAQEGDSRRIPPAPFLSRLYAAGAMDNVDAVGAHSYGQGRPSARASSVLKDLNDLRQVMTEDNRGHGKIWITELGSPTGTSRGALTEAEQAKALDDMCAGIRQLPWVGAVFVYQLRDSGTDPSDPEENFGLRRTDGSAKPSWAYWQHCRS